MCYDCDYHKDMRRDASIHAVEDPQLELGTGNKKPVSVKKVIIWRKFRGDVQVGIGADQGDSLDTSFLTIKPQNSK